MDFTMYWKAETVEANLGKPIRCIGSSRFPQMKRLDVLWIFTSFERRLKLVNRFVVGQVTDTERAMQLTGREDLWDAEYQALTEPEMAEPIRVIPLRGLTSRLRFDSSNDRLRVDPDGKIDVQQLRTIRKLKPASAMALNRLWTKGGELDAEAGDEEPYAPDGQDTRERMQRAIRVRRGQTAFRKSLLKAYKGRCAISGCQLVDVLEAAHISPYRGVRDNDPSNGILLRADLHTLFDLNLLGIRPDGAVVHIHPDAQADYGQFHGKPLQTDVKPCFHALVGRWEQFDESPG